MIKTAPLLSVNFFMTHSGNEPVREWLRALETDYKKSIGEDIKLIQFRWPLGMPLVRKMETDLWEARSNLAHGNISRIFFTISGSQMVLLHGFIKKAQKTPKKEIEQARRRKNEWFKEVKNNE
ncbi:MAG: type II toxin-antitoxin system RelE/ParE family toxin [gamma proteobacterium symbiont of Bathyaustriella thionipta]|nr:type II toxin-antitoxin system RelE/ParE family toxin [gamma proteobacterium symbiont of Bathyaustriella thionipta]MCU7950476.1 type II toxin-antitoxin system RelE/ParE family toxin [gamma proteobacterium symbiont of Bathyaustriella thionipta]MCU7954852.1 type II toxin-antitoxin system RelE/ParE family toxin [gamma proteobacterium symbiont of Bathyaustriella thionipta]MCU7956981.1 type II toxin-antitoxin system RelE/ParE family toxin [gamma proteobacterium symbiont of Bathyaustriella thionipt